MSPSMIPAPLFKNPDCRFGATGTKPNRHAQGLVAKTSPAPWNHCVAVDPAVPPPREPARAVSEPHRLPYAQAGVDIAAGTGLVELIKPLVRATARAGADAEIGGFGGVFDIKRAGYSDPVLVAATDGVGTKVKIAIDTRHHRTRAGETVGRLGGGDAPGGGPVAGFG